MGSPVVTKTAIPSFQNLLVENVVQQEGVEPYDTVDKANLVQV